jgi:hypothetical protein
VDPRATLLMLCDALDVGDLDAARDANMRLTEWLIKGGYKPDGYEVVMSRYRKIVTPIS